MSGSFSNAHHFILNSPTFYEVTQNVQRFSDLHNSSAWRSLLESTIGGVEFDASERDPPPKCHPGTRAELVSTCQAWRNGGSLGKRMLWLNGPAGVGKSAIVQTLAELDANSEPNSLGATLFFSRPNHRDDPTRVIPTIAYQLAVKDASYLAYITERLSANPGILQKTIKVQFKHLIQVPFGEKRIWRGPSWSIYLDGLDELDGERAQCSLVEVINDFTLKFPEAPLLWAIASRPEHHLKKLFSRGVISPNHQKVYVPIDSPKAVQDVERYLREKFVDIQKTHSDSFPADVTDWPGENRFGKIAQAASGHFAFASTVVEFVGGDSAYGNPVSQLNIVLAALSRVDLTSMDEEQVPFASLDALYMAIISAVPAIHLPIVRLILGCGVVYPQIFIVPMGWCTLSSYFGFSKDTVHTAFQRLHSVVKPPTGTGGPIALFHSSFSDFLSDQRRSKRYFIDTNEMRYVCWCGAFRILQELVRKKSGRSPQKVTLSWDPARPDRNSVQDNLLHQAQFWFLWLLPTEPSLSLLNFFNPPAMLETLGQVRYDQLEAYLPGHWAHSIDFFIWVRYHAAVEIREGLLSPETDLNETLINRARVDRPTIYIHYQGQSTNPYLWSNHGWFMLAGLGGLWNVLRELPELVPSRLDSPLTREDLLQKLRTFHRRSRARILGDAWAIVEGGQPYQDSDRVTWVPLLFLPLEV